MTTDNKRAKNVSHFLVLPFEGEIRVVENEVSIWADIQDERVYISTQVFKSDTVQEVQDRLINEWEIEKDRIEKENEEYESPEINNGRAFDNLTN